MNGSFFKFEECWSTHQECQEIIKTNRVWKNEGGSFVPLHQNLKVCAKVLGKWGKNMSRDLTNKIKMNKQALKEAYDYFPEVDFNKIHAIEFELDKLLEEEEIYWRQRSQENWLRWGDQNISGSIKRPQLGQGRMK